MENNTLTAIKAWITAAVAMLTAFWGWFGWLLIVWIVLMLADWMVGSAAAAHRWEWSSAKLRVGVYGEGGNIYLCQRTGEASCGTIVLQYMPHELVGQLLCGGELM